MYEVNNTQLTESLTTANPTVFTSETVELILDLAAPTTTEQATVTQVAVPTTGEVTVPAGTDIALLSISGSGTTNVVPPKNIPVIVFESATGSVNVEFNDDSGALANRLAADVAPEGIKRVVVGPGGADKMTVKDNKSTYMDGGTGNDTLTTGGGNDSVIGGQGNDSVAAGAGNDTIVTGQGNDTVDGGSGFDVATIAGNAGDYVVTVEGGELKLAKAGADVTTLKNVQYVQLNDNKAVIATDSKSDAAIAVLYETLFDRTADAEGLAYWMKSSDAGSSNAGIANLFVSIGGTAFSSLNDSQFVDLLYQNTFNRSADQAGKDYWLGQLASGHSRGELAAAFADIAVDNFGNSQVTTVGYVKIIDGLI